MIIIRLIVSLIWGVIGFVLWLPLLTRIIAVYCTVLIISQFKPHPLGPAANALDKAVSFYAVGFAKINESLSRKTDGNSIYDTQDVTDPIDPVGFLRAAAVDIIWLSIFWWGALRFLFRTIA
jgi:hypothetical protein